MVRIKKKEQRKKGKSKEPGTKSHEEGPFESSDKPKKIVFKTIHKELKTVNFLTHDYSPIFVTLNTIHG